MDPFCFQPDRARTRAVDRAIRDALVDSVTQVLSRAGAAGFRWTGDLDAWSRAVHACERAPPCLWAVYHALVQAILDADDSAVPRLATELLARPCAAASPGTVVTITADDLGPVDAERYRAIIDSDAVRPLRLQPVSPAEVQRIRALVVEARALLAEVDPTLRDEIDTLGHQIVLATGGGRGFGGAASIFLWGAVVLNPARVPDRVTLIESLAHESAHALLFGMIGGADLTTNDPAERYASPLRPDPRPIEGIVHATYVLARMNHALSRLGRAAHLTDAERAAVAAKLARNRASFESGRVTVEDHARFTDDGAAIFQGCLDAMVAAVA